jgi:hypothetical protein
MAKKLDELCKRIPEGDTVVRDENTEGCSLEVTSTRIKTVEQALAKAKIDGSVWEVDRCVINSWEVGAKGPDGKVRVTPLWQVKVWLKAKQAWNVEEFRRILTDDYKKLKPKYRRSIEVAKPGKSGIIGVLCIFDHHFGKLAWEEESGENYDLKIATKRYNDAAIDLLHRLSRDKPERIVYVVGNDFLHVDQGGRNQTTRGTQVDADGRWQKAFRAGLKCAIETVEKARMICQVDVMTVSGNHDSEKLFCMGEALNCRFEDCDDVTVDNSPNEFTYYRYGTNLLGFTHGDGLNVAKQSQLANKMAVDRPQDWSETNSREWFLGHKHREKESVWLYRKSDTIQKVVIRECPSLCGSDAWHAKNLYMSPLGAECHLYHKKTGRLGYLTHTPLT